MSIEIQQEKISLRNPEELPVITSSDVSFRDVSYTVGKGKSS
jgi:hypothetical protein